MSPTCRARPSTPGHRGGAGRRARDRSLAWGLGDPARCQSSDVVCQEAVIQVSVADARRSRSIVTGVSMLVDAMLVTTVAVTDLEKAKTFYRDQVGLDLLEEQPFAIRFG